MRLGWRIVGRPAVRAWQRAVGALPDSPLPALPWPQRLAIVLFPALLGPLQLVVFGPHHLYASNLAEFSAPLLEFGTLRAPGRGIDERTPRPAGTTCAASSVSRLRHRPFTVGLLLWIQGNLIVGDYGLLDGQPLDFARHDWRTPYELALWIGVPALAITAARTVVPIAVTGSRLLVLLQTVVLGASAVQVSDAVPQWQGPPEAVFELSAHRNVLHIVLDTFQSDTFLEIAQADRDEVDRRFAGFEFFVDHAGAFPTTYLSIPAMLTGAAYRNTEPIPAFIENQFDQESLFSLLGEAGYDIDYLSGLSMGRHATNAYRIARPYTTYRDYTRFTTWQLIDLAMFRHAPHVLKPWIYNGQAWRLQTSVGAGQSSDTIASRLPPVNGQVFFEEFTRRMTVARDRPVYKFLHVMIPHPPIALNEHCAVVDLRAFTRENYTGQARCAVRIVMRFLDRLRALGVYDDSLIIVSSDHGAALPPRQMPSEVTPAGDLAVMTGRAMALLLVKPPQREGPLRVSTAPTAITDIPATILDLLGLPSDQLPGIPASRLAADSPRERTYASYGWRNEDWQQSYFSYLDIFSLTGRLTDPRAWRFVETIYDPTTALEDRARGLFNAERDGRGESFRWTGATAAWAGPPDARGFTIQLRATAPMPQHVRLTVGGEEVGELALDDHAWHTLRVPVPLTESTTKGVRVDLVVEPTWRPEGNRRLGVMTRHVEWTTRP